MQLSAMQLAICVVHQASNGAAVCAPAACGPQHLAACPQRQCAGPGKQHVQCSAERRLTRASCNSNQRPIVLPKQQGGCTCPRTHKVAHLAVAVLLRHLVQRAQLLRTFWIATEQGIVGGRRQGRSAGRRAGRAARGEAGRSVQCDGALSHWRFGSPLATGWPPTMASFLNHLSVWGSKKHTWKLSFSSDRASSNAYSASPAARVVFAVVRSVEGRAGRQLQ